MPLAPELVEELAPLRVVLEPVNVQIDLVDAHLAATAGADPLFARLRTAPAIGPVTAVAFVATLDDVRRFRTAHQVAGYLGLTPREYRIQVLPCWSCTSAVHVVPPNAY